MSIVYSAKEIRSYERKTLDIETGLQSEITKPAIVSVGDPMPDADLLDSFLEQESLSSSINDARTTRAHKHANAPQIVVMNFTRLTYDAQKKIRAAKSKFNSPVVCLIPIEEADKLSLIESLGADDYLLKPFNPKELACRVKILLRRHLKSSVIPSIDRRSQLRRREDRERLHNGKGMEHSMVQIDKDRKQIRFDKRKIALTPREYALFCLLASDPERVFSPQEIIDHLWSNCQRATAANVQQYIYMLRKKIEPDIQHPRWLITIRGFGYRMNLANA